jgi:hypothetical protein
LVDLDQDGRLDMISGDWAGHVIFFRRQADGSFAAGVTLRHADGTEVGVKNASAPFVADWNGDGKPDLLVGDVTGTISWFANLGDLRFGPARQVAAGGTQLSVRGDAAPCVADWDLDGKPDLIVGDGTGEVRWFRNTGSSAAPELAAGELLATPFNRAGNSARQSENRGQRAKPCVVDWNGDGLPDLLVGYVDQTGANTPLSAAEGQALREQIKDLATQLTDLNACHAGESRADLEHRIGQRAALVRKWAEADLKLSQSSTHCGGQVWLYLRPSAPAIRAR